ncbi:protein lifeguard 3-like [Dermatophagoides pteronyssinus]|uniref:protein lifeguard 3-like n=1 Tax=Dermatophagoides pteronyssinus TaxID=6956 RepID=UPI003F680086
MGRHSKSHGSYDVESGRSPSPHRSIDFGSTFNSITIRNAFIRKVYGILALQFAFTTLIIFLARNNKEINQVFTGPSAGALYIGSLVAYLVIYFTLICCESCRRTVPNNYVLLMLFVRFFQFY